MSYDIFNNASLYNLHLKSELHCLTYLYRSKSNFILLHRYVINGETGKGYQCLQPCSKSVYIRGDHHHDFIVGSELHKQKTNSFGVQRGKLPSVSVF